MTGREARASSAHTNDARTDDGTPPTDGPPLTIHQLALAGAHDALAERTEAADRLRRATATVRAHLEAFVASERAQPVRILLVDDDQILAQTMKRNLARELHATIDVEANGMVARQRIDAGDYDLAIVDLNLPGIIDGLGLITAIRHGSHAPMIPIIVISGIDETLGKEAARHARAHGYFQKPVDLNALAEAIRELLPQIARSERKNPS